MKNFDLDWWGISHKTSLDFILKNDDSDKINVYASGFTSLRDTYLFLNEEDKSRIFYQILMRLIILLIIK